MAAIDFEILDERFRRRVRMSAYLERLHGSCRWAEGPVYVPAHNCLIWSDIPNNRMLRYDENSGGVTIFRQPSGYSNGNTIDREGRLVSCEHGGRRVSRTEHDGRVITLADRYQGKRLNSPNDVIVRSDGSVWFTDPTYGIDSNYEGEQAESEIGSSNVYRIDPATGEVRVVADDFVQPNGLAFSCQEDRLYIADSGASHVPDGPRHIRVFDVGDDGSLTGGSVFATCTAGAFDGLKLDEDGRIWVSAADGVHCYTPGGELIGKIKCPETVANICFGGPKRNRLFICATTSLYSVYLATNGAAIGRSGSLP